MPLSLSGTTAFPFMEKVIDYLLCSCHCSLCLVKKEIRYESGDETGLF
jgi:hypothetical protein